MGDLRKRILTTGSGGETSWGGGRLLVRPPGGGEKLEFQTAGMTANRRPLGGGGGALRGCLKIRDTCRER